MSRNHLWSFAVATRLVALSALAVLLIQGCDDNGRSRVPEHTSEVIPLSTGNKWVYDYGLIDSIRASVEEDGQTWFEMGALSLVLTRNPVLVRMNDDNQFIVKEPEGEFVFFDFGVEVGTQWDYEYLEPSSGSLSYKVSLVSKTETVEVAFGSFEDCYKFYFNGRPAFDASWWFWIAEGTGIVKYSGGYGITHRLTEFMPSGRQNEVMSNSQSPILGP